MPKMPQSPQRAQPLRRLSIEEGDVLAAKRLLRLISEADVYGATAARGSDEDACHRADGVERAQQAYEVRQRRVAEFDVPETAFQLLLTLYVHEAREATLTVTRLTELSGITSTSTLRWLEPLVSRGWVSRADDKNDGRKTLLSLTQEARRKMEQAFCG